MKVGFSAGGEEIGSNREASWCRGIANVGNKLYTRPQVTDLYFQLFDRPIHPELIDSLESRHFEHDGYRLALHLTPAGHIFQWRRENLTLAEVLAIQTHPLPEYRQLFTHRVGGERTERFLPSEDVCYQTCFQVEWLAPQIFCHLHDELRHDGETGGVLYLLRPHDRLGLSPLSYLDLQARPGSLIIHAYHTYPDEFAIVKTQTLIEVTG